jgi:hypothetical protein
MGATATPAVVTPYVAIEEWGLDHAFTEGLPSADLLVEIARALHAIDEFLVEPAIRGIKETVQQASERAHQARGIVPENERAADFAYIGRFVHATDVMRIDLGYLLGNVAELAAFAHEELPSIANGYAGNESEPNDVYRNELKRFHGLDDVWPRTR